MKKTKLLGGIVIGATAIGGIFASKKLGLFKKSSLIEDNARRARLNSYYTVLSQWVSNKIDSKNLADYFKENDIKTIAIYGMGTLGELLYQELKGSNIEIKYFVDKNADKLYYGIDELPIVCVDKLNEYEKVDAIIVTPVFDFDAIEEAIMQGASDSNVISLDDVVFSL